MKSIKINGEFWDKLIREIVDKHADNPKLVRDYLGASYTAIKESCKADKN